MLFFAFAMAGIILGILAIGTLPNILAELDESARQGRAQALAESQIKFLEEDLIRDLTPVLKSRVQEFEMPAILSVDFAPDGQTIVSGSFDGTIRLWQRDGTPIGEPFTGHESVVYSVAFAPDGQTIVSGSTDNTIRLWGLDGTPIGQPFIGHTGGVFSVAFSPDGQTIVSGSSDNTIRLWRRDGTQIGEPFTGHADWVRSVNFDPEGHTIVSGGSDNTIRLWRRDGTQIGEPFTGHEDTVYNVDFDPDGQTIVSGSEDGTIRFWQLNGTQVGNFINGNEDWVQSVDFTPNGWRIVSGGSDGEVKLWQRDGTLMWSRSPAHIRQNILKLLDGENDAVPKNFTVAQLQSVMDQAREGLGLDISALQTEFDRRREEINAVTAQSFGAGLTNNPDGEATEESGEQHRLQESMFSFLTLQTTRAAILAFVAYFIAVMIGLYRTNSIIAAHYTHGAIALELAIDQNVTWADLTGTLTAHKVTFGKDVSLPQDQIMEILKSAKDLTK